MSKVDQSKVEVYVCGFVPKYLLPTKMLWSSDPFLRPLIVDLEIYSSMVCCPYSATCLNIHRFKNFNAIDTEI